MHTAQLTDINHETVGPDGPQWWDTITICDEDGTEVDVIRVESSEHAGPYFEAVSAAGYTDYQWKSPPRGLLARARG